MPSYSVACVGLATLDLVHRIAAFPSRPLKLRSLSYSASVGGMAAVAACAIARLNGSAQYWGPIGDDPFGATIRRELADAGVDASSVLPTQGATSSHSVVIVDSVGGASDRERPRQRA